MKDFLTLEEFILLPDDPDQKHTWSQPFSGDEWVARYKIAKNSFEEYGDKPPIGSFVAVLVNGHSCGMPRLCDIVKGSLPIRILKSYTEEKETNYKYYVLGNNYNNSQSLVLPDYWWRTFKVLNNKK